MDGCDHTVGLYIYDDTSISGGCVHTLDLRFTDDPSHSDGCAHVVDLFTYSSFIQMVASIPWIHF